MSVSKWWALSVELDSRGKWGRISAECQRVWRRQGKGFLDLKPLLSQRSFCDQFSQWLELLHRVPLLTKCFFKSVFLHYAVPPPLPPHSVKPFNFSPPLKGCLCSLSSFPCNPLSVQRADCFHLPTDMITVLCWLTDDGVFCQQQPLLLMLMEMQWE